MYTISEDLLNPGNQYNIRLSMKLNTRLGISAGILSASAARQGRKIPAVLSKFLTPGFSGSAMFVSEGDVALVSVVEGNKDSVQRQVRASSK